jgi:hypothetical protein
MIILRPRHRFESFLHSLKHPKLSKILKSKKECDRLLVLGAGNKILENWINSDIQGVAPVHFDFSKDWKISNSLDGIFGEMVWGEFNRENLEKILVFAHRALKQGGILRICNLDFLEIAKTYTRESDILGSEALLERNRSKGYIGEFPIDALFHATCGHFGMPTHTPIGSYLHDYEVFMFLLQKIGFSEINRRSVSESNDARFTNLESRNIGVELHFQFCIEAKK